MAERGALEAICARASRYPPHHPARRACLGRHGEETRADLSPPEREVLALMAEGRSNQAICRALFLSPKTVETHVTSIFTKLRLAPAPDDHRRALAVLAFLQG
jgi:DNA-binding NarL/FixJ family response regulator